MPSYTNPDGLTFEFSNVTTIDGVHHIQPTYGELKRALWQTWRESQEVNKQWQAEHGIYDPWQTQPINSKAIEQQAEIERMKEEGVK